MNCQVTGIQFVVETRASLSESGHARLRFKGDVYSANGHFYKPRQRTQLGPSEIVEHDANLECLLVKCGRRGTTQRDSSRPTNDEIEILLPARAEVPHFMIQPITH